MSTFTDLGQDPLPTGSDPVLVPADLKAYADAIAHKIIHFAQDKAERDVQFQNANAPVFCLLANGTFCVKLSNPPTNTWLELFSASGVVTSGATAQAGWQISNGGVEKFLGQIVHLNVFAKRTGAALNFVGDTSGTGNAANRAGNIGDVPVISVTEKPKVTTAGIFNSTYGGGHCAIDTNGLVSITDGYTDMDILTNENVRLDIWYTVATA